MAPVRFRRVASGLSMEKVRSLAMVLAFQRVGGFARAFGASAAARQARRTWAGGGKIGGATSTKVPVRGGAAGGCCVIPRSSAVFAVVPAAKPKPATDA